MNIESLIRRDFNTITPFSGRDEAKRKVIKESALVVQDEETYYGVLTTSDLINKPYTLVIDCLTEKPIIDNNCSICNALELMKQNNTDVLIVHSDNKFKGLIFKNDIVNFINKYNNDLEQKIIDQGKQFIKLNEDLEKKANEWKELNSNKDILLSTIAHDLRQPFSALIGFSNLLLTNLRVYDMQKIEDQLKIINHVALNTFNLLEDLIIWSKSLSGNLLFNPEKLCFNDICNEVIKNLIVIAEVKNIKLKYSKCSDSIFLHADCNMLKTILRNLISNAIKFTNEFGQIEISIEPNYNLSTITVSDNGVGISKEAITKIWNYSTSYSTNGTRNEKGFGLGLFLCRKFVEQHGGEIWVESEFGKGSKFIFTLSTYHD